MVSAATSHAPNLASTSTTAFGTGLVHLEPGSASFQRRLEYRFTDDPKDTSLVHPLFPGILIPQTADGSPATELDTVIAVAEQLGAQPTNHNVKNGDESQLRKLLDASGGAILFRDAPIKTAHDFSRFAHALAKGGNWHYHVDKGLMVLRYAHAANVATANEGPNTAAIGSHNEYGLSTHFPSYAFFFCLSPPTSGGETPITSSLEIYDKLNERDPAFIRILHERGVTFSIHHQRNILKTSVEGNSLLKPDAFGPTNGESTAGWTEEKIRQVVDYNVKQLGAEGGWRPDLSEGEAANLPAWQKRGFTTRWLPDGSVVSEQRVPGVRPHPWLKRPTFFNNIHNRHLYCTVHSTLDYPHESDEKTSEGNPVYQYPPYIAGFDAETDPDYQFKPEWLQLVHEVVSESQVDIIWKQGDVLLLDNLSVQHARRPWEGPRKLLASFWDGPEN